MSVDVWMDMPKEESVKQRFFFFLRGIFQSGPYYPFVFSLLTNVDEHLWNWTSVEAG